MLLIQTTGSNYQRRGSRQGVVLHCEGLSKPAFLGAPSLTRCWASSLRGLRVAEQGHLEVAEELLASPGADKALSWKDSNGRTPLALAAELNDRTMALTLARNPWLPERNADFPFKFKVHDERTLSPPLPPLALPLLLPLFPSALRWLCCKNRRRMERRG